MNGAIHSYYPEVEIEKTYPTQQSAWTAIYGERVGGGGKQQLLVKWERTDGKILEATFDITIVSGAPVTPTDSEDNQEGQQGGGSEHIGGDF